MMAYPRVTHKYFALICAQIDQQGQKTVCAVLGGFQIRKVSR